MRPRESELFCALLLGYRPGIDPEDRARFAGSGLGHLLAVSGLHLAILAGLMGWLLRKMGVGRKPMAVALGWLLQRSPNILLIPGTSKTAHLRENLVGAGLLLSGEDVAELDRIGR